MRGFSRSSRGRPVRLWRLGLLVALLGALLAGGLLHAVGLAADGNPVVYDNWSPAGGEEDECSELGEYAFAYKVNEAPNGSWAASGNTITIRNSDGYVFDWNATDGIGAVIVKAGTGANVWFYDPQATSDTGLYAYQNKQVSHVTFCWNRQLVVTKDVQTSFTRTYEWDIEKTVSPDVWNLFTGDSGTSEYTVSLTKTGYTDSGWAVSGNISIYNPAPAAATITAVSDVLSGDLTADVDCGVNFPYTLPAGGSLDCTYSRALPDGSPRTNTATVTTTGSVGGASAEASVTFGAPTNEVNARVSVSDSNGQSWGPVSSDTTWTYEQTFSCDADEGTHNNTATIDQTGQSDSASVSVNCYALTVSKDAETTFTRTHEWDIDKSVEPATWDFFTGESGTSEYSVAVSKTGYTDSDWAVTGTITISNPAPMAATLTSVTDTLEPDIAASVDCPPLTVPAQGTLTCSYGASLPNSSTRTNTAMATLQNYGYDKDGGATPTGTTPFGASAAVVFRAPTTQVNESISVTDTNGLSWGPVSQSATWAYTRSFTCDDAGVQQNTATIVETGQSDDAAVLVACRSLEVTKDADTGFTRTYEWAIEKSVEPATWNLLTGETGTSEYAVAVTRTGYSDSGWAVTGTITITNPASRSVTITGVSDVVSPATEATVDCGVEFPYTLASEGTLICEYNAALPDGAQRTNTVTVTTAGGVAGSATADVVFDEPTAEVNAEVNVVDTNGLSWGPVSADSSWAYSRTFTCDADQGTHDNTAIIVETEQSDDATVTVSCSPRPEPGLSIEKTGPDGPAQIGDTLPYTITVVTSR